MFKFRTGNILDDKSEAVINTVNCVGIMGKGLAKEVKQRYYDQYIQYHQACKDGSIDIGKLFITETNLNAPRYLIHFPTKTHWRYFSKYEYINAGLIDLVRQIELLNIRSIAIPPLGCGNGGLEWYLVLEMIVEAFNNLNHVKVTIYHPEI